MGITQADYARHRAELGLPGATRQGVAKALRDGRIKLLSDGTIDPARADAEWTCNTLARMVEPQARRQPQAGPRHTREQGVHDRVRAILGELKLASGSVAALRRWVAEDATPAGRRGRVRLIDIPELTDALDAVTECSRLMADLRDDLAYLVSPELRGDG